VTLAFAAGRYSFLLPHRRLSTSVTVWDVREAECLRIGTTGLAIRRLPETVTVYRWERIRYKLDPQSVEELKKGRERSCFDRGFWISPG
jgi:hypothetical protein